MGSAQASISLFPLCTAISLLDRLLSALQDIWPSVTYALIVMWWARVIRHPTIIMSVPSWGAQKPFYRVGMLGSMPFSFAEMERVDLLVLDALALNGWELNHIIPLCALRSMGLFMFGLPPVSELPWTLPSCSKKRKKIDESFCRVRKGHCFTCWAKGSCLYSLMRRKWFDS